MKTILGRSLAIVPPIAGAVFLGTASSPSGAAPPSPAGVTPACSANWQIVASAEVTYQNNGVNYGTANLWYDSCSRDVKAQVVNAPISPGYYAGAEIVRSDGTILGVPCVAPQGSCTTGAVSDAGITSKARAYNDQSNGSGGYFQAVGFTSLY